MQVLLLARVVGCDARCAAAGVSCYLLSPCMSQPLPANMLQLLGFYTEPPPGAAAVLQVDVTNRTEGRAYTDSNGVPVLVHYDDRWVAALSCKPGLAHCTTPEGRINATSLQLATICAAQGQHRCPVPPRSLPAA